MLAPLPFSLEPMQLADITHVMTIERRVFTMEWSTGIYRQELTANPWSHYFVLRASQPDLPPVLSYGGIWQMDIAAHVPTIATHPDFSGRGLGSFLLLHLLNVGCDLGCTEATLEVRASNQNAQRLYLRHGFAEVGRRRGYYSDNWEDALIMTRPELVKDDLLAEFQDARVYLLQNWQRWSAPIWSSEA